MERVINAKPLLRSSDDDESDSGVDAGRRTRARRVAFEDDSEMDDTKDSQALFRTSEPQDHGYLVYLVFYLLGMTTLMPWNFFITAEEYWLFKFRDIHNETSIDERTPLQSSFMSYLSLASSLSSGTFLVLNTFISQRIPLQIRMIGSLSLMLICFIITTIFVKIDTDSWQTEFFIITMLIVVILNIASAILSGGIVGVAGKFPTIYMTAVVSGQALGGIFAALANILSLTFSVSAVFSTLIYFVIANATILMSLIAYMFVSRSIFFKYYTVERIRISFETSVSLPSYPHPASIRVVLKKIWICAVSIWLTFTVSLSIFPAITGLIDSQYAGRGYVWNDVFFVPVVSYLLFSVGDYLGRVSAGIIQRPRRKIWLILFLNCCRLAFIPLLMLCNAQPRHLLPVLISKDLYYILIMAVFAFSNGYMTNIGMITAPKLVEKHEHELAAVLMAALLGIGLACGAAFGTVLIRAL